LSKNLIAFEDGRSLRPHSFRSLGQVATLGRREGIADIRGMRFKGLPGWLVARAIHLMQVPGASRRLGVLSNWILSLLFPGNIVTVAGLIDAPSLAGGPARPVAGAVRLPPAEETPKTRPERPSP
jgi:NADH dehydrogenase